MQAGWQGGREGDREAGGQTVSPEDCQARLLDGFLTVLEQEQNPGCSRTLSVPGQIEVSRLQLHWLVICIFLLLLFVF
jgi:hypothetical protein